MLILSSSPQHLANVYELAWLVSAARRRSVFVIRKRRHKSISQFDEILQFSESAEFLKGFGGHNLV